MPPTTEPTTGTSTTGPATATHITGSPTHEVTNQVPAHVDWDVLAADTVLGEALLRHVGPPAGAARLGDLGLTAGVGAHATRAAGFLVWTQVDAGHGCHLSMTYAAPALCTDPSWRRSGSPA